MAPGRLFERIGEHVVSQQHRGVHAILGDHGFATAANDRFVDDIVMNQRGIVDELHDARQPNDRRCDRPKHLGRQQQYSRTNALSPAHELLHL